MQRIAALLTLLAAAQASATPAIAIQGAVAKRAACFPLRTDWAPQPANLKNVWHLDDVNGTMTTADAIAGNTANGSSISTQTSEHVGKRALFNGPGSDSQLATSVTTTSPAVFTYTIWFNTTSFAGGGLFGFADSASGTAYFWDRLLAMNTTGQLVFGIYDGMTNSVISPLAYNDGSWHHAAAVFDSNVMTLYIDGSMVATASTSGSVAYGGYFRIGTAYMSSWPGFPTQSTFSGYIDEAGIWQTALSSTEIAALAASIVPVGPTHPEYANLFGLYHFEETGGNFADSSLTGNTMSTVTNRPLTFSGGVYGNRILSFNAGCTSYTTTTQFIDPQDYTLMAWFLTPSAAGGVIVEFGKQQTASVTNYDRFIAMENSGQLVFGNDRGGPIVARTPLAYNDSKWHLVVATSTNGSQVIYVDGNAVATSSTPGSEVFDGYWRIANGSVAGWPVTLSQNQYYGYLDEVAWWDVVLTPTEVKKVFDQQLCGLFNN